MSQNPKHYTLKLKYTAAGVAFGLLFPTVAIILTYVFGAGINAVLSIVGLAPIVLGAFAYLLGAREVRSLEHLTELQDRAASRTSAIQSMLDVTGDGFLTFGEDLSVRPQYSKPCEQIFGGPIAGRNVAALLYADEQQRADFEDGVALFFAGKAKAEVIFGLVDTNVEISDRAIELTFRAIDDATVMCALVDVTDRKRLEAELELQNRRRDLILRVVSNRKYFATFAEEAVTLFQILDAKRDKPEQLAEEETNELATKLHTFKGNASFLGFERTATVAHDLEDRLNALPVLDDDIDLSAEVIVLKRQYYEEYNVIEETLGEQWMNDIASVSVPQRVIVKLEHYVRQRYTTDRELIGVIEQLRRVRLADLFSRYPQLVRDVAARRGKRVHDLEIVGGEFRVLPERFEPIVNVLEHVARNMVDHGIETPDERELKGKDKSGMVRLELSRAPEGIVIVLSDDGQGISFGAIEQRAREKGLLDGRSIKRADLLRILFSAGFSTAEEVSSVSGRGIGLNAVQKTISRVGGKISLETKPGRGTTFRFTIPERAAGVQ
ncbi:MAG: ATP-binding protein [Spirochaetales bacterium]